MDDVLDIFNGDDKELEPTLPVKVSDGIVPNRDLCSLEGVDTTNKGIQEMAQNVRAAFLSSKSPEEIRMFASGLPLMTWLDYFIKLQPKEVQVKGQFDIRQMIAQLGPVNRKGK